MRPKLLLIACAIATLGFQSQTSPDFTKARDESARLLQEVVRIDTSAGNETKVVEHVKAIFDKEGIAAEIVAKDPSRGNLVARIKGTGKKRPQLIVAIPTLSVSRRKNGLSIRLAESSRTAISTGEAPLTTRTTSSPAPK